MNEGRGCICRDKDQNLVQLDPASIMLGLRWDNENTRYKFSVPRIRYCVVFA